MLYNRINAMKKELGAKTFGVRLTGDHRRWLEEECAGQGLTATMFFRSCIEGAHLKRQGNMAPLSVSILLKECARLLEAVVKELEKREKDPVGGIGEGLRKKKDAERVVPVPKAVIVVPRETEDEGGAAELPL